MENSPETRLGPHSLKKFTKALIAQSVVRKTTQDRVIEIKTQVDKIKAFSEHPAVKKEAITKEADVLLEKLNQVLNEEAARALTEDEILKHQVRDTQLMEELKNRVIDLERELVKSEVEHRRDIEMQSTRFTKISDVLDKTEEEIETVSKKAEETRKEEKLEQEELLKIEQQLKNLEKLHSEFSKKKGYDRDHLKILKQKINSTKSKIKDVKVGRGTASQ